MKKLRVLDLFSGIGGFSLGLERTGGFETVAFCEIEEFPRKVLAKHWPEVPCYEDVRKLKGTDIGSVDVICGGYPCQPFSTAGKRRGKDDDRHLWPEFSRLVDELRPTWVIGENVAGHISMGLDDVLSDLEGQGYAVRAFVIPACAVGAYHRRERCWTIAHANDVLHSGKLVNEGHRRLPPKGKSRDQGERKAPFREWVRAEFGAGCEAAADPDNTRLQGGQKARNPRSQRKGGDELPERCPDLPRATWPTEPAVGRVAHGISQRTHRLKALGNAVVPQIPEMIGRAILESLNPA